MKPPHVAYTGKDIPLACPFPSIGRAGAPYGYNIDPGAGSAMDRLQRDWPRAEQVEDLILRGGTVTPLWPRAVEDTLDGYMIWSNEHGLYHRRDETEGTANGYTNDILSAGVFTWAEAKDYDGGERDKVIPLKDVREKISRRMESALADAQKMRILLHSI